MGEVFKKIFDTGNTEAELEPTAEEKLLARYITAEKIKPRTLPSERETTAERPDAEAYRPAEFQQALRDVEYHWVLFANEYLRFDVVYFDIPNIEKILKDGTRIGFGEILLRLHIDDIANIKKKHEVAGEVQSRRQYIAELKQLFVTSLADLARTVSKDDFEYGGASAIYGLTYLANRKLAEELGFETETIEDPVQELDATRVAYSIILKNQCGEDLAKWEEALAATSQFHAPRYAFMSKKQLLEQYGEHIS